MPQRILSISGLRGVIGECADRHRELGQELRIEAVTDDASQAGDAQNPLGHVILIFDFRVLIFDC